jgi:hypothetical protein
MLTPKPIKETEITMQAYSRASIRTKYLSATNSRGSRVKATCQAGSVTVPYDCAHGTVEAHFEAVKALMARKGLAWGDRWVVGGQDNDGFVFVPIVGGVNVIDLGVS